MASSPQQGGSWGRCSTSSGEFVECREGKWLANKGPGLVSEHIYLGGELGARWVSLDDIGQDGGALCMELWSESKGTHGGIVCILKYPGVAHLASGAQVFDTVHGWCGIRASMLGAAWVSRYIALLTCVEGRGVRVLVNLERRARPMSMARSGRQA
jgi:hypothetical protein